MTSPNPDGRIVRAFLVGPTGVGKTDVAVIVARRLGAEIINIDSRQIYRKLDIGTAKPSRAQMRAVPHHLVNYLEPTERCSAGRFVELVRSTIEELQTRGRPGIAVGGAGLYVDACLGRFHQLPPANEELRIRYEEIAAREGPEALHRLLEDVDPVTAHRLAPRDRQRIVRALEVAAAPGGPLSARLEEKAEALCSPATPVVYLTRERRELYARIEERCAAMVASGLPEEVRDLLESGLPRSAPGLKSLGYVEWGRWAVGEWDRAEAMDVFVRNSRRYAKRQETWFRNRHPDRIEIRILPGEPPEETAEHVLSQLA
jgi:tRNA dimethylallyltransferase